MFTLGQAAGLLATTSKYCNKDAVPLQKQHNDKCTLKKLMEYSIDTFSKKDNDSGETADAANDGDACAQSQQQCNSTKGGCCGRRGVTTAKKQCSQTPGKDTNQSNKSSCCGGCCGKKTQQYKNNECSSEKLAKSTCSGTKKNWKETVIEGLDTVAEYADNVIAGVQSDLCASQPFPECRNCPYRSSFGQGNQSLGIPRFMNSIDSAIDALTRGAVGTAIDLIGCPGIAGAIARGDYGALGAAMVDSGIRSLVASAISAGSVPVLDSLMSVLPTDMQQTLMDPRLIGDVMHAATCGGSSAPSKRKRTSKDLKTTAAKAKMGAVKSIAKQKNQKPSTVGSKAKEIENATPSQLVAIIVRSNDEDEIIAAIVAAGDDADEIVAKAIAAKEAQENSPLAAYVDGIYTGSVGAQSAGADLSWFDDIVNMIITTGNSGDTFFLVTPDATANADAKFVTLDEYTGSKPVALLDYQGREFKLSDADKEALTTINTVVNAASAALDKQLNLDPDKGKVCLLMLDKCPSEITSAMKAIDIPALRMKTNCPAYRLTQIPGCTISADDIKAAIAIDVIDGNRETPVDLEAKLVSTDVDLLIYK